MLDSETLALASQVVDHLRASGATVVTAESCTGGLIAAALTHAAGASDVVDGGFVTYSNALKHHLLSVTTTSLEQNGAVSEEVAVEMAMGALGISSLASHAIAVTGIAGPGGGSDDKPVGMVCIALQHGTAAPHVETNHFDGDRATVRQATVRRALTLLLNA